MQIEVQNGWWINFQCLKLYKLLWSNRIVKNEHEKKKKWNEINKKN